MEIFQFDFMRRAFLVGIILAIIIPCIGVIIVLKRLSMIGDAISHTSLAGITFGLVFNINPILASVIFCIIAALSIEYIRKKISKYGEMSIAIIMSLSVSVAGLLSGFVSNNANFNSFLFGSIVAISDFELKLIIIIGLISILIFILLYKERESDYDIIKEKNYLGTDPSGTDRRIDFLGFCAGLGLAEGHCLVEMVCRRRAFVLAYQ